MLSNAYFLAKCRFYTAENEPSKNLQKLVLLLILLILLGLRRVESGGGLAAPPAPRGGRRRPLGRPRRGVGGPGRLRARAPRVGHRDAERQGEGAARAGRTASFDSFTRPCRATQPSNPPLIGKI